MAPRRTLNHALEITADKLAFIRHGSATAASANVASAAEADLDGRAEVPIKPEPTGSPVSHLEPAMAMEITEFRNEPSRPSLLGEVLVPLTTRIRPETANALRRAYLEQKLAHRTPATQQEIIEAALTTWLQQYKFL